MTLSRIPCDTTVPVSVPCLFPYAYCFSTNSRSSNSLLQVSLNKRNGTHHNSFVLFFLFLLFLYTSYFFPSALAPRKEKMVFSHPSEGSPLHSLQCGDSCVNAEHKAGPTGFHLVRSYTFQCPVSRPRFSLRSNKRYRSTGPENQAATLLYVGRVSRLTILSLENSQTARVGSLAVRQSLVSSS